MLMFSLEGEMTSSTTTWGKRSKSNSYSIACTSEAKIKRQQRITASWPWVFSSLFLRHQVKATSTPPEMYGQDSNSSFWQIYLGIQRWKTQGLPVCSMRRVIWKNVPRHYGGTTTKNQRMHQKDDCHLSMVHLCQRKGGLDTLPFCQGCLVLTSTSWPHPSSWPNLNWCWESSKAQTDAENQQRIKLTGRGDARRLTGTDAVPINHFVRWFQAISPNMEAEAQKRALATSRKATASICTDVGDDKESSTAVEVALVQGDLRRVEYSEEMA